MLLPLLAHNLRPVSDHTDEALPHLWSSSTDPNRTRPKFKRIQTKLGRYRVKFATSAQGVRTMLPRSPIYGRIEPHKAAASAGDSELRPRRVTEKATVAPILVQTRPRGGPRSELGSVRVVCRVLCTPKVVTNNRARRSLKIRQRSRLELGPLARLPRCG